MTTVIFSERETVLLACIQDTVRRQIKPQQCSLICRFVIVEESLYLITVHDNGYVTVENASTGESVGDPSDQVTVELEKTLLYMVIEQELQ